MTDRTRGEDIKTLTEDGWYHLWDGTPGGWIRSRPALKLEYWV